MGWRKGLHSALHHATPLETDDHPRRLSYLFFIRGEWHISPFFQLRCNHNDVVFSRRIFIVSSRIARVAQNFADCVLIRYRKLIIPLASEARQGNSAVNRRVNIGAILLAAVGRQ